MLCCTCSAEVYLASAFNSTLFSQLSCLLSSCLSGNSFRLEHTSPPSLWNSHMYCSCVHWGCPLSLYSSLFPLTLSSIISLTNLPSPFPSHFHWRQLSCAGILAPTESILPTLRYMNFSQSLQLQTSMLMLLVLLLQGMNPFSTGEGCLIFKWYEVNWCGNMWAGFISKSNFLSLPFNFLLLVNGKKTNCKSLRVLHY